MKIAIIGLGLIGGSIALSLKKNGFATQIIGVDNNENHGKIALDMGMIDAYKNLECAISKSDLVILAIPVDASLKLIDRILNQLENRVLIDVGSTKSAICKITKSHKNRGRYVATHPMWGTEFSGPKAALTLPFKGNAVVICDADDSDSDAMQMVQNLYESLGMRMIYMDSEAHDVHAAYVSHISHITSFALANTVLKKEKKESAIFSMASGGFESTVRLAKSSAAMWSPIFKQNKENVLDVLTEHIAQLNEFKNCIEQENEEQLYQLIENANTIRRILK